MTVRVVERVGSDLHEVQIRPLLGLLQVRVGGAQRAVNRVHGLLQRHFPPFCNKTPHTYL